VLTKQRTQQQKEVNMDYLEAMNEVAYISVSAVIARLSEKGEIPADEAAMLLAGNAVRIVTLMRGEQIAREMVETAIADAVKSKKA
jgi:predicted transcriptional regulator